jgi:hypothetical protein
MSLEYKILGQELVSYTDVTETVDTTSYYVSYEETSRPLFVTLKTFESSTAAYSTDGITWAETNIPSGAWGGATYGDGKFVAVGYQAAEAIYSRDGITWTQTSIPSNTWMSLSYGNGKFVATSFAATIYSTDGITWTQASLPIGTSGSLSAYGGGKFVAMGSTGSSGSKAIYSTDGITWTETSMYEEPGTPVGWQKLIYSDGKFLAIGFVLGGDQAISAFSVNGVDWTLNPNNLYGISPSSITYGNGKFVGLRYNSSIAIYSTDGITWTQTSIEQGLWNSVTYDNGKFVAIGYQTSAAYSLDGISWTSSSLPSSAAWYRVIPGLGTTLAETLNIIGGQGTTQTEEFLPITVYTVPAEKQTTVTSIFVANHDDTDSTYDLAVVPAGEELSLKHHIRWDMAVAANDFENISTKITMSAGDKLVIFPSTVDTVSITAFGVEK